LHARRKDNFAADREFVAQVLRFAPKAPLALLVGTLGSGRWREDSDILAWFGDWEMIEPGLAPVLDWRSDEPDQVPFPEIQNSFLGGVARKK
jgi:hypothetical protein